MNDNFLTNNRIYQQQQQQDKQDKLQDKQDGRNC